MPTPKTLTFIIGPQAVGKMTVGHELSRITGYPHLKIDNESLSPQEVATEVCAHFELETIAT